MTGNLLTEKKDSSDKMWKVYLQSFGAAQTVTGSKHLLYTPKMNILIDCGLFQGIKSLREKNWETPAFDPKSIDIVCLTHAHLDHCGYLPRLISKGFKGKVMMSAPTRALTELILRDSAKIQEEDAWKANRYGHTRHRPALPLYTISEVERCLSHFEVIDHGVNIQLAPGISMRYILSAHIPGACSIEFSVFGKIILFSGDIGREHSAFLAAPAHGSPADFVIMESTYGDRLHDSASAGEQLATAVNSTVEKGGNIMIPCFAVGRAQEIIRILYLLKAHAQVSASTPVYLDSPMASAACQILLHYPEWSTLSVEECRSMMHDIRVNEKHEGTAGIIADKTSKIIIAGSGMLSGGRILEYLKHYIGKEKNTLIISGFQAEGTRGRALLENTHEIRIDGKYYPVKAQTVTINSLSAHADQAELIRWLKGNAKKDSRIFLVHGEPNAQESLRVKIKAMLGFDAHINGQGEKICLFEIPLSVARTQKEKMAFAQKND